MNISKFLQSGHKGTLLSAFIYSDMSFMVWVLMGPLVIFIAEDLNLTEAQQYTLVSIPLLAGVLFRIPVGILVDHFAPKCTGLVAQLIVIVVLLLDFLSNVSSINGIYFVAITLGIAGTSMAVALPLCSRREQDKVAMPYQGIDETGGTGLREVFSDFKALYEIILAFQVKFLGQVRCNERGLGDEQAFAVDIITIEPGDLVCTQ